MSVLLYKLTILLLMFDSGVNVDTLKLLNFCFVKFCVLKIKHLVDSSADKKILINFVNDVSNKINN